MLGKGRGIRKLGRKQLKRWNGKILTCSKQTESLPQMLMVIIIFCLLCDRHCPGAGPFRPKCIHSGRFENVYGCAQLSLYDIKRFHSFLYSKPSKEFQDHVLVQHMVRENVQRRRVDECESKRSPSHFTVKYFITNAAKQRIRVCFQAFRTITGMGKSRLNLLSMKMQNEGMISDRRGGFKQAARYRELKDDVMAFIRSIPTKESHYCRAKTGRTYLPAELNIEKLYSYYLEARKGTHFASDVKSSYFRAIFVNNFNIGFGAPVTDACSTCSSLRERIKATKGRNQFY